MMAGSPDTLLPSTVSMADGPQAVSALWRFEFDGAFDDVLKRVADALDHAAFNVAGMELGDEPHDARSGETGRSVLLVVARKLLPESGANETPTERVLPIIALVYEDVGGRVRLLAGPQPLYERVCGGSSGEVSQSDDNGIAGLIEALKTVSRPT